MKKIYLLAFIIMQQSPAAFSQNAKNTFTFSDSAFILNGKPFQIISGEMHYPRVPKEAWRDRMRKAKAMGLNTIGTYVFWNLHEPQRGKYDFSGNNDIVSFIKIAKEEGLWVILRPSPYVCAEWEFGGYPYWLQNISGLQVRSKEKQYLDIYRKYINEIGKRLAPHQINHNGNILMVQIENEYGSYGSDKEYLDINRRMFIDAGFDGILYTCDPKKDVASGALSGLLPAVNGIDNPKEVKDIINQNHAGKGPYFVAEWYPAWFDWWGTKHHKVPAENYAGRLDTLLQAGISVNMYMFHGGSTRDFMNGANYNDKNPFEPQISSYDYDAPLDEAGNPTYKYLKFREAIEHSLPIGEKLPVVPDAKPSIEINNIKFTSEVTLFSLLNNGIKSNSVKTFEELNQPYGFLMYSTSIKGNGEPVTLKLKDVRDYAIVFVNGKRVAILDRRLYKDSCTIVLQQGKNKLDILVENLGRINFGPYLLKNKKGITEEILVAGKPVTNWTIYKMPFNAPEKLVTYKAAHQTEQAPVLKTGAFSLSSPADTYLDFTNWGKGIVWVNGHNLGRYWAIGPQQTVYVPVEWLKKGVNEIKILELLKPEQKTLRGVKKSILDVLQ